MANRTVPRIGLAHVRDIEPGQIIWEQKLTGFGIRRQLSAAVSYIVVYRNGSGLKPRWYTIGKHGRLTPDTARNEAKRILGEVSTGKDPAQQKAADRLAENVSQLCDRYLADAEAGRLLTRRRTSKKASTLGTDRGRIERHIKPLLGCLKVAAVTRDDVEGFMHSVAEGKTATRVKTGARGLANVRGGQGTASRTMGLLGSIFAYAIHKSLRPDNPVHGVTRFADKKRDRRLSDAEYAKLGKAFEAAATSGIWPPALAAARFLLLTGWRRGEVIGLKWFEIDLDRRTATLSETKTGRSLRPLSEAAVEVLRGQPSNGAYIFAASRGDGPMTGFPSFWHRIAAVGGLPSDVTPHTLRHSYASLAADLGYSESTIAALIGHSRHTMTSRYVHSADAVLLAAADAIADEITRRCHASA